MGDKNPILLHYFYGKIYPEDSFKLKKEEVSDKLHAYSYSNNAS